MLELLRYDRSFRDASPPDCNRAELVVGRLFQSTAWSEHDERRRVADFEALRAAIGIAVRDASAQTTADDERDALGLAAETLESLAALV